MASGGSRRRRAVEAAAVATAALLLVCAPAYASDEIFDAITNENHWELSNLLGVPPEERETDLRAAQFGDAHARARGAEGGADASGQQGGKRPLDGLKNARERINDVQDQFRERLRSKIMSDQWKAKKENLEAQIAKAMEDLPEDATDAQKTALRMKLKWQGMKDTSHHEVSDEELDAALNKQPQGVEQLQDLEALGPRGATPLIVAAMNDAGWAIKMLAKAGAQLEARDEAGYTALHMATQAGNLGAVKALIEVGADVTAEWSRGGDHLRIEHLVCLGRSERHVDVMKYFVENQKVEIDPTSETVQGINCKVLALQDPIFHDMIDYVESVAAPYLAKKKEAMIERRQKIAELDPKYNMTADERTAEFEEAQKKKREAMKSAAEEAANVARNREEATKRYERMVEARDFEL